MRHTLLLLLCGTALCGTACKPKAPKISPLLMATQARLNAREGKLGRYRYAVKIEEAKAPEPLVAFDFTFLVPGLMRARYYKPHEETLTWDGQSVVQILPAQKLFRQLELPRSPSERQARLIARFAPFMVEGFYLPSLPSQGVQVKAVSLPKAKEAVAIQADFQDQAGNPVTVTYTLRWPSADFLVKRTTGKDGSVELRMDEERCEPKLALCFPLQISEWKNGERVKTTQVLELELFESPLKQDFKLTIPEGYTRESAKL